MITIDEAIKRLTQRVAWLAQWKDPEDLEDMKLLIEAGKRIKVYRADWKHWFSERLPGETEG